MTASELPFKELSPRRISSFDNGKERSQHADRLCYQLVVMIASFFAGLLLQVKPDQLLTATSELNLARHQPLKRQTSPSVNCLPTSYNSTTAGRPSLRLAE